MKTAFPENFPRELTLKEAMDASSYPSDTFTDDVIALRNELEQGKKLQTLLIKHFTNTVTGIEGRLLSELMLRVVTALDNFEKATKRANDRVSAIVNHLEDDLGTLQGITTGTKMMPVDTDSFLGKMRDNERAFFNDVYFNQNRKTRNVLSPKQYAWMTKLCERYAGARLEECFFTKPLEESDLELD